MKQKVARVQEILRDLGSVVVAFSGGVDSTLLLKLAVEALGSETVLAVTAGGEIYPRSEREACAQLAAEIGAAWQLIEPLRMDFAAFRDNPPDRCYHCKKAIFAVMQDIAQERGLAAVVDGSNADDLHDYRPGARACRELGIRSPLQEAGLSKAEIRQLSHELGLPTWNKPSMACLASRFPYGTAVTPVKLAQVEAAEELLKSLGFLQYRVRHHGSIARIEVLPQQMQLLCQVREMVVQELEALGFDYVALDLRGYRTGAMNEVLPNLPEEA